MSTIKLVIRSFGDIKSINIELTKFTVLIAADNDNGTIVAKLLSAIHSLSCKHSCTDTSVSDWHDELSKLGLDMLVKPNTYIELTSDDIKFLYDKSTMTFHFDFAKRAIRGICIEALQNFASDLNPVQQRAALSAAIQRSKIEHRYIVMSTFNSFMLSWLTLSVKANMIEHTVQEDKLNEFISPEHRLSVDNLSIYQFLLDSAWKLSNYNGIPSDNNCLNNIIQDCNEQFSDLLELEQNCK